jgi:hypothetical protein
LRKIAALFLFGLLMEASGATPDDVRPLLEKHCHGCHGPKKAKGDLRLDELKLDFADLKTRRQWEEVAEMMKTGEMPPEDEPQPAAGEKEAIVAWVEASVAAAVKAERAAHGRVVLRRLNRVEYENTLRDLLGVPVQIKDLLPLDTSAAGFDNVGEALHTSSFLLDRYLEAAETALSQAIANRPQPKSVKTRYLLTESHQVKSTTEKVYRSSEEGVLTAFSSSAWQAIGVTKFYPQERGAYRFRISASAVQSEGKPVTFRVWSGAGGMGGSKGHLVGYFDAPASEPEVFEYVERMEPRTSVNILPFGLPSSQTVHKIGAENYTGPGLKIDWVEVEGPLNDTWPPESHRRIFGDLPQDKSPIYNLSDRVEVVSQQPGQDANHILKKFARSAFRRAVTDSDVAPYLALFEKRLAEPQSFEKAIRASLAGILTSPEFLFLRETPGKLDDFALASRLSYFLWSSQPDDELLTAAEAGKLSDPGTMALQLERLLKDPKSKALVENFTDQWLGIRDIDFTIPSHILYPDFDDMLKASMVAEARLFFQEVLNTGASLTNFLDSDFAMLNGRLAKHYGIPGMEGWGFERVALPPDSPRGGVLTMAGVMKVTANGTSTSPVMRGSWVMDRILGKPPTPPPANVPPLEPDTRGATTIRERLDKHRELESCNRCHAEIDPPGFALESFDVIGGWRDRYRQTGNGTPITIEGRNIYLGANVDPSGTMADGRVFKDIEEFKKLLLAKPEVFARALTAKLITYGTGAPPEAIDAVEIERIVSRVKEKNYSFRSLIHEIVRSPLFTTK